MWPRAMTLASFGEVMPLGALAVAQAQVDDVPATLRLVEKLRDMLEIISCEERCVERSSQKMRSNRLSLGAETSYDTHRARLLTAELSRDAMLRRLDLCRARTIVAKRNGGPVER